METNNKLIALLEKLENIEKSRGKIFEARAYSKATEALVNYNKPIKSIEEIKHLKNIGTKIYKKFDEYLKTNTLSILENAKNDPILLFYNVYGIGPKKAIELVEKEKITTIKELREREDLLNDKQKIGLKYYEDILKRIPRDEIDEYLKRLTAVFKQVATSDDFFEIVGSYRRQHKTSGDIDIIISNKKNNREILDKFINKLQEQNILIEILSKGKTKSLTIARLKPSYTARRIDFMYSPPDEFAFSTLYFTGSKNFNVVQRKIANDHNLTLNEHGLYHLSDKKVKQQKIDKEFLTEKDIFEHLNMVYKEPHERKDGRDAILKSQETTHSEQTSHTEQTSKTEEKKESFNSKMKKQSLKANKKIKISKKTLKNLRKSSSKRKKIIEKWQELKSQGITAVKGYSEDDIYEMLTLASKIYYNEKKPLVSDEVFDILKEYANKTYPDNEKFNEVGAEITKKKLKLPYYLGSMDKIKPDTKELEKYLKKYSGEKILSAKLDGISAFYSTEQDKPMLATRGKAINGLDISHMIPYMKLPNHKDKVLKDVSIRGELIIKKDTFEKKYKNEYKNPRNFVSGVVNSIKFEPEKWKDIDFVGYEVIKPSLKPSEQIAWLIQNNVIPVKYEIMNEISNDLLSKYLVDWRDSYHYETDGIIVTDDKIYPRKNENPKHAFAFKMVLGDQIAEAKIIDVIWTTSKDKYIKPVAQIEPVNLKGVTIEHVTAFNAKFVNDNNIGIGSVIELVRSGDVIPHINKVIKQADTPKMPDVPWHWNKTKVDAISDVENDPGALQKSIEFFFKKLDVKGLGPGNVAKFINANFNTIPKILAATKEEMMLIDGFKEKTVDKIHTNIHSVIDNASLVTIASASNIFKRGIGEAIIKNILDKYPDIFVNFKNKDNTLIDRVALVDNVSNKRAEQFVEQIPEFLEFIKESKLENKLKITTNKVIDKNNILYDKKIVFSGIREKALEDSLLEKGVKLTSSVSKNTFIVLVESNNTETTKTQQAIKLNIPILTIDKFKEKYL